MTTAGIDVRPGDNVGESTSARQLGPASRRSHFRRELGRAWKYRELYLLLLPTILFFVIFRYIPMGGLVMGFQNYSPVRGFLGSPWVGFQHFETLFALPKSLEVFRNTVIISLYRVLIAPGIGIGGPLSLAAVGVGRGCGCSISPDPKC